MTIIKRAFEKYKSIPLPIKASFWYLVCSFLQKGISFITTPIFARLLTTSEYGRFSVFNSWLSIATVIITLHISSGVYMQGIVKNPEKKNEFTSCLQGLTLVLVSIWTAIYFVFRDFWNNVLELNTIQVLFLLILVWTSSVYGFWASEQRVNYRYLPLVLITLIVVLAKPILGIILVVNLDERVTARIMGLVIVEFACFSWMFFYHLFKGKRFFSKDIWLFVLGFSLPLIPHYLSQTILNSSDRIMIERMTSSSEAGIYSLAYSISTIMTLFNTALVQTLTPWLYKKIKNNRIGEIKKPVYIALLFVSLVNLCLILLAPEVVYIFGSSKYSDAIWIVPSVAMSVYFSFMYNVFAAFEFYFKKPFFIAAASVTGAVLNILLNFIFIPIFGYYAAGYTTLFCFMVYAGLHYLFMIITCKKHLNTTKIYNLKVLSLITFSFLILGFAFLLTYFNRIVRYIVVGILLLLFVVFFKKIVRLFKIVFTLKKSDQEQITVEDSSDANCSKVSGND